MFYIETGCAYNVKFTMDLVREFNGSAYPVTDLYYRCLGMKIKGLVKYRIDLHDEPNIFKVHLPDNYTKIAHYHTTFDFAHYFAQPKPERRKIILETLHEAVVALCEKAGYDLAPFTAAYQKVKELNYENRHNLSKPKASPNRQNKATIQVEVTEEAATISVEFQTPATKGEQENECQQHPLGRGAIVQIARTKPHFFFIQQLVHSGKWTDNEKFTVSNKSAEINFVISLKNNTVNVHFEPKTKTVEQLQNELDGLVV